MVEIGGKPIIWHIMKIYSAHGINEFIICLGYKGYMLKEYFSNYYLHMTDVTFDMSNNTTTELGGEADKWKVTLIDTGQNTMTGGRLKRIAPYVGDEDFCMTYGDAVSTVDIGRTIAFHRSHGKLATVTAVRPPARFGALDIHDGTVLGFREKPLGDNQWINGGFFVLSPKALDTIEGDQTIWEQAPMETLAHSGQLESLRARGLLATHGHAAGEAAVGGHVGARARAVEDLLRPSPDFWRDKRVFLTGHTGFKGTWLALWLTRLGATVRGYALPPDQAPNLSVATGLAGQIDSLLGDIRDVAALDEAISGFAPDIVLHLAAQALVQRSYRDPVETFEVNVTGTIRVLEAVRRCPSVRAVVVVTTDKCYENREWVWAYRETEALGGRDPYSASKACTELAVAAWRASFFDGTPVGLASARAGNVIGGGDWAENRLIPDCIRAMTAEHSIEIRSPHATRPWQHVLDPLRGYLLLRGTAVERWRRGGRGVEFRSRHGRCETGR